MAYGDGWAEKVVSVGWARVASGLFRLSRLSGFRLFAGSTHAAWCRATGHPTKIG